MKTNKALHGSGKTKFTRLKEKGESWVALRDKAIKDGLFHPGKEVMGRIQGTTHMQANGRPR